MRVRVILIDHILTGCDFVCSSVSLCRLKHVNFPLSVSLLDKKDAKDGSAGADPGQRTREVINLKPEPNHLTNEGLEE